MSGDALTIQEVVALLRAEGVVAFPTETVYGLGADAFSEAAVERVFEAKGRPGHNPLIVHVSGPEMARRVVEEWPARAAELAQRYWPGPLTLVLPKSQAVPGAVTGGGTTVGVRCPDHPVALELIEAFGGPLVGPSANRSGGVSPTTANHVRTSLPEVPVLDGGPCHRGLESTVVSIEGEALRLLRPGIIGADELGATLQHAEASTDGVLPAPGLMPSHYAPRARVVLVHSEELSTADDETGLITHTPCRTDAIHHVALPSDPVRYAAGLYAALHALDDAGVESIFIERPADPGPVWDAIRDRLSRAAAPRD